MPWSGGTFSRSYDWTEDEAGDFPNIEAERMDGEDDNFASGINDCLHKSGQNSPTADLPMGGNNHTGVGNATALDEYASASDVINQSLTYYLDSGSADEYVITPSPAISAYAEGQRFTFRAVSANTGATTLNVNAKGATAVETPDGSALTAGMIAAGGYYDVVYDANGSRFVLMSSVSLTSVLDSRTITSGDGLTGGGDLSADRTLAVGAGTGIAVNADDVALSHLGIESLTDPGADRLFYWDDSATATNWLTVDNGLTIDSDDTMGFTDVAATTTNPVDISSGAVSLDVEALTTIEGNALAATDTFYVEDGGVSKGIEVQEMGLRVVAGSAPTDQLTAADMNSIMEFTSTATLTLPLNSGTALPVGVPVVLNMKHATQELTVTAATSVTLVSVNHPGGGSAASDTVVAGGTALLFKTAADVWCLTGDIAD